MKNTKTHSAFGRFYFRQPIVVRKKIFKQLQKGGLGASSIRWYMYDNRPTPKVPPEKYFKLFERATKQKIETLFPY